MNPTSSNPKLKSFWQLAIGARFLYHPVGEKTPKAFVKIGAAEFSRIGGKRRHQMFRPGLLVTEQIVEALE